MLTITMVRHGQSRANVKEVEAGLSTEFVAFGHRSGVTVLSVSVPLGP